MRQDKPGLKGEENYVTLKFRTRTSRVERPPRQRLTSRREASLVRHGVTHDVKRRQRVRGPRDRASKVTTCGADGVGKLEGCSNRAIRVRRGCPTGVQERGTRTGRVLQEPGRPRSFLCRIPGRSPGDQGPGCAQVRAAPTRGANEAVQHGYNRPSPPRAIGRRARSRSPQYYQ